MICTVTIICKRICCNMQNNMQSLKSICRIVQCLYSAYSAYVCTPHFADARLPLVAGRPFACFGAGLRAGAAGGASSCVRAGSSSGVAAASAASAPAPAAASAAGAEAAEAWYAGIGGRRGGGGGVVPGFIDVLESALHTFGLGATASALNLLDVLVIGDQDGLELRPEGVRLHVWINPPHWRLAEVLVHWWFRPKEVKHIFQSTKYLPTNKKYSWMTMPMKTVHLSCRIPLIGLLV